jgi:hypothetical protein
LRSNLSQPLPATPSSGSDFEEIARARESCVAIFRNPFPPPSSGSDFREIARAPNSVRQNQNNNPARIPKHSPTPRAPNRRASLRQRREYIPVGCHSASCLAGCRKKAPRSGTLTPRKLRQQSFATPSRHPVAAAISEKSRERPTPCKYQSHQPPKALWCGGPPDGALLAGMPAKSLQGCIHGVPGGWSPAPQCRS